MAGAAFACTLSCGGAPTAYRPDPQQVVDPSAPHAGAEIPAGAFRFDPTLFSAKRPPRPGDWLATHDEKLESFEQYVRNGPTRPTAQRHTIVLQPLGPFSRHEAAMLETLREYL